MIPKQLHWYRYSGRPPSPFTQGVARALAVTVLETDTVSDDDRLIFDTIRWLARSRHLDVWDGSVNEPRRAFRALRRFEVTVDNAASVIRATMDVGAEIPYRWQRPLAEFQEHWKPWTPFHARDIGVEAFHRSETREVLATSCPFLLANRDHSWFQRGNILPPTEAVKLIGLFLRSRGDYSVPTVSLGRLGFYWVLTRERLPAMWRYFSACVSAQDVRGDDILQLGQSVLVRCVRALQARDAIGAQSYQDQNNTTSDEMLYHFDYMLLMLVGAFDAQARVANRCYHRRAQERGVTLWEQGFVKALEKHRADKLHAVVTSSRFSAWVSLLTLLRNTVHAAGLNAGGSVIGVPVTDAAQVLVAVSQLAELGVDLSSVENNHGRVGIRMYPFAAQLTAACLELVNAVADATDVTRLFPACATPSLVSTPPSDSIFEPSIRRAVSLLG